MRMPSVSISIDDASSVRGGWRFDRQRDFTGGENKLIIPELVGPNQLISAQNCVLSADGLPETRKGKFRFNKTEFGTSGFTSFHRYSKENGTRYLILQQGTAVYAITWDGTSPITSLGSSIKTLTSTTRLRYVTWKDRVFATNGVDNIFTIYYDGASWTVADVAGSPPKSKVVKVYANRLFVVPTTQPNCVQFSNLEDYTTWDVLDIIKIRDADGDSIQAISPQSGGLVVAKSKSVWVLYGTNINNFNLPDAPLFAEDGCACPDAFLDIGLFMGYAGLYTFNLSSVTPAFNTHKSVIQDLTTANKAASFGVVDPIEKRVLINLGSGDTLCIQEQVHPLSGERYFACMTWTGLAAGCMCVANDANDPCNLLIGDVDDGFLYALTNSTDDDGTAIETFIKTAYADKNSVFDKVWRRFSPEIEVLSGAGAYTMTLGYDLDYELSSGETSVSGATTVFTWGTSLWGDLWGTSARLTPDYYLEARGSRISFELTSKSRIKLLGYHEKFREVEAQ